MGPSGSGKSTLLNLLGALDHPCRGEICFEGQSLATLRDLDRFRADLVEDGLVALPRVATALLESERRSEQGSHCQKR